MLQKNIIDKNFMNINHMLVVRSWCDEYFSTSYGYYLTCLVIYMCTFFLPMTFYFAFNDKTLLPLYISSVGYIFLMIVEVIQLRTEGLGYLTDAWNLFDVSNLFCYPALLILRLSS